jgi:hypothetical protein
MVFMTIKIGNRHIVLEKSIALKVLNRMEARKIHGRQIAQHMREAHMGPRPGFGSQLAGWLSPSYPNGYNKEISSSIPSALTMTVSR